MTSRAATILCFACCATLATGPVFARPSTLAMSCAEARSVVSRQGAIVLGTGGQRYDRFVRHGGFCEATEIAKPAFAPTRDQAACMIGYTCYEPSRSDRLGHF